MNIKNLYLNPDSIVERALALSALQCHLSTRLHNPIDAPDDLMRPLNADQRPLLLELMPAAVTDTALELVPFVESLDQPDEDQPCFTLTVRFNDPKLDAFGEALIRHAENAVALRILSMVPATSSFASFYSDFRHTAATLRYLLTDPVPTDLRIIPHM